MVRVKPTNPKKHVPAAQETSKGEKTKNRKKPGENALKEVAHLQRTMTRLLWKKPFVRLVCEIAAKSTRNPDLRFQYLAVAALHQAYEAYLMYFFEIKMIAAIHAKRVTMKVEDMRLVKRIRGHL